MLIIGGWSLVSVGIVCVLCICTQLAYIFYGPASLPIQAHLVNVFVIKSDIHAHVNDIEVQKRRGMGAAEQIAQPFNFGRAPHRWLCLCTCALIRANYGDCCCDW